jgi:hypothetical protein
MMQRRLGYGRWYHKNINPLIYLHPQMRLEGKALVNAWAGSLIEKGRVPFHSYKIENADSANLARRPRLQPVFEEIAIPQI